MLMCRIALSVLPAVVAIFQAGVVAGQTTSTVSELAPDLIRGQAYPNKPIRIVTTAPGGGNDFAARLIGQGLTASLGQQVIVDNRTATVVPGDIVARAAPDGYVLLLAASTFYIGPLLDKAPYDAMRDFAPITLVARSPNVMVVHPSVPVSSVAEFIAYAKAKPGVVNYGSTGIGSSGHLAGELFKFMARVNFVHIPYKASSAAAVDLLAGNLQLAFNNPASVTPHIKAGRLKALAVCSAQPSPLLPGLPTVSASGLPGYESGAIYGLLAPARTPAAIIKLLNQEVVRILNTPDAKAKFFNVAMETVGSTPEQLAATMKSERARLGKVIKDAGIRSE